MYTAAIAIHPPKRPSFEDDKHSGGIDGKPSTPDRHSAPRHPNSSSEHTADSQEGRIMPRNSSEKSIDMRGVLQLHGGYSDRSLGHGHHVEFQDLMQLPPPHLYTCTVGRNRSGARCVTWTFHSRQGNPKGEMSDDMHPASHYSAASPQWPMKLHAVGSTLLCQMPTSSVPLLACLSMSSAI